MKILNYWVKNSNPFELSISILIGFALGDLINHHIIKTFHFDSFILSTLIGISSIYLSFFIMGYLKKKSVF
ncbi:hypothetical protein GCM10011573_38600 [Enterococcus wangshanyuanii]|uniref:F0F1-ATPase subunit Ca2+/Mg2+ transporter n=1 Tax=Enterococcus wangshanyuanii TaxID=2005703 RepID=A0ABQ1PXD3_9ENTE|nr:hypothetical protein GCM10011573_38600 [Enterococcus wangshanyuanii]